MYKIKKGRPTSTFYVIAKINLFVIKMLYNNNTSEIGTLPNHL